MMVAIIFLLTVDLNPFGHYIFLILIYPFSLFTKKYAICKNFIYFICCNLNNKLIDYYYYILLSNSFINKYWKKNLWILTLWWRPLVIRWSKTLWLLRKGCMFLLSNHLILLQPWLTNFGCANTRLVFKIWHDLNYLYYDKVLSLSL